METVVKNIHYLKPFLNDGQIEKIEHGALQYRKFSRIYFKVISFYFKEEQKTATIDVWQEKSPAENYLDGNDLFQRCKDLFAPLYSIAGLSIQINTRKYVPNPTEGITPEYIRSMLTTHKIKQKDLVNETGIDATNLSAWINGVRPMSEPVKAMFHYYFNQLDSIDRIRINIDPAAWQPIDKLPMGRAVYLLDSQGYASIAVVIDFMGHPALVTMTGRPWKGDREKLVSWQFYDDKHYNHLHVLNQVDKYYE